ncbi:hypothetical protein [Halorussus litoreus]|uniref:hypothetical protein n=1 Tax=Halorussus litoreus TaxID=1710536 RepID=UPI000E2238B7|nr:hypothetical protein [Halorussus litoreus]
MSIETTEDAHDPAQTARESTANEDGADGRPDDELVVVICQHSTYEQLRPELDESRERLCRRYDREYETLLSERAQLADEVEALERQLARKESQLDAVVARNEQILEARTESYRRQIAEQEADEDDIQWTGRRQSPGLLARLKNWLR